MKGLTDRVALITGASRGIGAATALMFAEHGADVAINYHASRGDADDVAARVRALGRRAEVYQGDVTSWESCRRMCEGVLKDFGRVDILVNNAGIGYETLGTPLVADTDPADLQKYIDYNTLGCLYMVKLIVPQMRTLGRGNVVMVSSFAAQALRPRMGAYSISKAGMEALAQTLAKEEREHGIRVNIVAPGLVDTAMGDGYRASMRPGEDKESWAETAPFGFICQPEDVAGAVLYLCSDEGRYVTGQRITVNGGGA